ncbi:cytochrome P450 [Plectosphaerella plurivora]|uniref:Cytochrome P450 n=1 Tax=Plectosphaerella plurivora TaxID=936078 RepID=A0A9P8VHW3_9PEZI|nr:cytochrome P450 [Plectosphaerella plurivora]
MGLVLASALAGLTLLLIYRLIVVPAWTSPLAHLPAAHWSCHISPLWILAARRDRRENTALLTAHRRLGPVVRVGPADVSLDGVEALRIVYQGGFEKDSWYSIFANYGADNMFSALASKAHASRKRAVSHVYSKSSIQTSRAARAQTSSVLHTRLLPLLLSTPDHDVFPLFLSAAMDLIAAFIFGRAGGTDFLGDDTAKRDRWLELYLARAEHGFFPQELPRLTAFCRRWMRAPYPRWVDEANEGLAEWNWKLCQAAKLRGKAENDADESIVFDAINASMDKGEQVGETPRQDRDQAIASEIMDHLLAGQETAGIALTYAAWHLSRSPALQAELRTELLSLDTRLLLSPSGQPLPDPKALDALPLLHAVVTETLRLHAPIPGPEPRRTPKKGCRIAGHHIPGGVRVASLAHTLHRDERVFPDAEAWQPSRWLASEKEEDGIRREMLRHFWAFGSGGRMCVGSNFAMNEMKYILAAIYTNFRTSVVDDVGIEQADAYTARPRGERLVLRFERVEVDS